MRVFAQYAAVAAFLALLLAGTLALQAWRVERIAERGEAAQAHAVAHAVRVVAREIREVEADLLRRRRRSGATSWCCERCGRRGRATPARRRDRRLSSCSRHCASRRGSRPSCTRRRPTWWRGAGRACHWARRRGRPGSSMPCRREWRATARSGVASSSGSPSARPGACSEPSASSVSSKRRCRSATATCATMTSRMRGRSKPASPSTCSSSRAPRPEGGLRPARYATLFEAATTPHSRSSPSPRRRWRRCRARCAGRWATSSRSGRSYSPGGGCSGCGW